MAMKPILEKRETAIKGFRSLIDKANTSISIKTF